MSNDNILRVKCKNIHGDIKINGCVIKSFRTVSNSGTFRISARLTNIGMRRFINIMVNTSDDNVLTYQNSTETDLTGQLVVDLYSIDGDPLYMGSIENVECRKLSHTDDPYSTLFNNEKRYLNSIDKIRLVHCKSSFDDIYVIYNRFAESDAIPVNDVYSYRILYEMLKLRVLRDLSEYYDITIDKSKHPWTPLTTKEITDILHKFTDNITFESFK